MTLRISIITFLLFACITFYVPGQSGRPTVYVIPVDSVFRQKDHIILRGEKDSIMIARELQQILRDNRKNGFLGASFDSIRSDSATINAYLYRGPQYQWANLSFDSIDRSVIRKAGIRTRMFKGRYVNTENLADAQKRIIKYCENNGYPFASVGIKDLNISGDKISGCLVLHKNQLFVIDSLIVKGSAKISVSYLERLLGIRPGDFYNEQKLASVSERIRETGFIKELKPYELEFFREEVDVYTYLEKGRANSFNGIIGFLPRHQKTSKLLLTGDVNLYLINSFGRGESVNFNWRKLEPLTQELKLKLAYPYIFSSSVGFGFDVELFKQDTSFLTVNPVVNLRFFLDGSSYFRVYLDYLNTSLLSTRGYDPYFSLNQADVNSSLYGVGLRYNKLDYFYNPRRGLFIEAEAGIGSKKVRRNPKIDDRYYEDIDETSTKLKSRVTLEYFVPLSGKLVFTIQDQAGYIHSPDLFENEMFRLGGIQTLRGVEENSVLASFYSIMTAELRYLFEQNSALYLFFDGGYYEKKHIGERIDDTPVGFGAGINLETRAGIFTLNYALGRQFDNPVNLGTAKVHLGYVSRF